MVAGDASLRHDLDDGNELEGSGMRHQAAIQTAHAAEDVGRRSPLDES
jgi:hypothetical protein